MEVDLNRVQPYFDESDGQPLQLVVDDFFFEKNGIQIELWSVPLLKNCNDGSLCLPNKLKQIVKHKLKNPDGPILTLRPTDELFAKRFEFCEKFDFLYSSMDYEFIPGLVRPWDDGFLTPVYFNSAVLNKYSSHPEYRLDLFSESYGSVFCGDLWDIAFGVNSAGMVIMWLGDIDGLPDNEKYYLRSENIESNHDIHSEFYNAQIDVQWAEPSLLGKSIAGRQVTSKKIFDFLSVDIYQLEGEIGKVIEDLSRPVFWDEKNVSNFFEALNRIFVESISSKNLKSFLEKDDPNRSLSNLGGLKLLSLFLSDFLLLEDSDKTMMPFFVLYDIRIILNHLQSEEKKLNKYNSICERLGIEKKMDNYQEIYEYLLQAMLRSFDAIEKKMDSFLVEGKS